MRSLVVARHPHHLVGIVGPVPDPIFGALERELDWLELHGVTVERIDPVEDEGALDGCPDASRAWRQDGTAALPLVVADGELRVRGRVPSHRELLRIAAVPEPPDSLAAARRLAAVAVTAALQDPEALEVARADALANGLSAGQVEAAECEARRIAGR